MRLIKYLIIGLLIPILVSNVAEAAWKYNPHTGKLDYYESGSSQTPWTAAINAASYNLYSVGNVGIGTTSTALPLTVTGQSYFNGNVGIGTTSPNAVLDVSAPSSVNGANLYLTTNNQATANGAIHFKNNANTSRAFIGTNFNKSDANGNLEFGTNGTANTDLIIDSSGNVGIGTTTPLSKLGVNGNVAIGTYGGVNAAPSNGLIVSGNVGIGTTATGQALTITGSETISGNIGIGTTSVANPLTVTGAATISGNVGIGTTGPGYKLTVAGGGTDLAINNYLTAGGNKVGYFQASSNSFNSGTTDWRINNALDTVNLVTVLNGGNVGIGTTGPATRLEVGANSGTTVDEKITVRSQGRSGVELLSDTANSGGEPGGGYVYLTQDNSAVAAILGTVQTAGTDPRNGNAYTNASANATLLGTLDSNGALQFGTNNIVAQTINTSQYISMGTQTVYNNSILSILNTQTTTGTTNALYVENDVTPSSDMANFSIGSQSIVVKTGASNMTGAWGSGGLVGSVSKAVNNGAGTVSNAYGFIADAQNLNASGTTTNSYTIFIPNPYVAAGSITNSYGLYINNITSGATSNYSLYVNGGKAYFGGNVGIGTTAPLNLLDVRGTMAIGTYAGVNTATANGLIVSGNIGIGTTSPAYNLELANDSAAKPGAGGTWTVPSDARLKDPMSIKPYTIGLSLITQLNPVYFRYNGEAGITETTEQIGFIAQDLETIMPSAIRHTGQKLNPDDTEDILGLNIGELQYATINAIKELQNQINELKDRITQLEKP